MKTEEDEEENGSGPHIRFVQSRRSVCKSLVMDNRQLYNVHHFKRGAPKTYFQCVFHRKLRCPASLNLYNFNPERETYDSCVIINGEHVGHEPSCVDLISELDGKEVDKKELPLADSLKGCPHVCLFCCKGLPTKTRTQDQRAPTGDLLSMDLSNSVKNEEAFEFLCEVMGLGTPRRWREELHFEVGSQLPLCYECQVRYQEMWQLQTQIKMLERLIEQYVKIIRESVRKTENRGKVEGTQLGALGLNLLRKLIINPAYKPNKKSSGTPAAAVETPSTMTEIHGAVTGGEPTLKDKHFVIKEEQTTADVEDSWMSSDADPLLQVDDREPSPECESNPDADTDGNIKEKVDNLRKVQVSPIRVKQLPRRTTRSARNCNQFANPIVSSDDEDVEDKADPDVSDDEIPSSSNSDSDFEISRPRRTATPKTRVSRTRTISRSSSVFARLRKKQKRIVAFNYITLADREYRCHLCFNVDVGLQTHINHFKEKHPDEKRYTCNYCGKYYERHRDILAHTQKHRGERLYQCTSCPKAFVTEIGLQHHENHNHNNCFKCPHCEMSYSSRNRLDNHLAAVHDEVPDGKQDRLSKHGNLIKTYVCHVCDKSILGRGPFYQHYAEVHPEENRYTCRFCGRHYEGYRACINHQRSKHTSEKAIKCPDCPKAFCSSQALQKHTKKWHSSEPCDNFRCPHCDKGFPSQQKLTNHLIGVHDEEPECERRTSSAGNEIRFYTCHICEKSILGRGPFYQHYRDVHPEENRYTCRFCGKYYKEFRDVVEHQRNEHTGERPFKCEYCNKAFVSARSLKSHKDHTHRDDRQQFSCEECGKICTTKHSLAAHRDNTHSKLVFVCKMCGKPYRGMMSFTQHNKKVHQGKAEHQPPLENPSPETLQSMGIRPEDLEQQRVKCHICWESLMDMRTLEQHFGECHPDHKGGIRTCQCGKRFAKYNDLRRHALRHKESNKSFHCDQCPKSFYFPTELRNHLERAHLTEEQRQQENHVCDVCGVRMANKYALLQHVRNHEAKEKGIRFVCEDCGKSYAHKKGLSLHRKTEHVKSLPHKCPDCGKGFAMKCDLKKHATKHTGAKPYKCPHCERRFGYPSGRLRHVHEIHGVDGKGPTPRKKKAAGDGQSRRRRGGANVDEEREEPSTASTQHHFLASASHFQFPQGTRIPGSSTNFSAYPDVIAHPTVTPSSSGVVMATDTGIVKSDPIDPSETKMSITSKDIPNFF